MEQINTRIGETKGFTDINEIQNLNVDLERSEKILPLNDIQGGIDAYEQYLKEKDACNKYRLVFTIRPFCTNVLFNRVTEAIYKEGSDNTQLFLREKAANIKRKLLGYSTYKKKDGNYNVDENSPITRDTGYSSNNFKSTTSNEGEIKVLGHLDYNCGADIFNNHLLRKKEFVCVNPINDKSENWKYFNTLFDLVRDPWAHETEGFTYNDSSNLSETTKLHLYNNDSIYTFKDAINHNLKEKDGWLGFINTAMLRTATQINNKITIDANSNFKGGNRIEDGLIPKSPGFESITTVKETTTEKITVDVGSINRIINNEKECNFIDMYPTRKHYSFAPHVNEERKRLEKNWEYCLTYPFENEYNNYIVSEGRDDITGILCDLDVDFNKVTFEQLIGIDDTPENLIPLRVDFRTHTNHSLQSGDKINLHCITPTGCFTVENVVVVYTGKNGYDNYHYFTLTLNDISTDMRLAYEDASENYGDIHFRFEKISIDRPCKYYLRKFKKIPNFKNTPILPENGLTEDDINNTIQSTNFSSSLNKLGFSKTIYGDDVAQIVYDDDIEVAGLRDNLGREVSVIYLTLLKTNYGYKNWYGDNSDISHTGNDYANSEVEYSHCFGALTSGFDLPAYANNVNEYNVHTQHNIPSGATYVDLPETSNKLETTLGETEIDVKNDFVFYGDLVELDENILQETVLERMQCRFNTAQRETINGLYSALTIDNIVTDDYQGNGFTTSTENGMCDGYWANLGPEGYYYQAHYPVQLKEYSTTVNTGYHTEIKDYEILLTNSETYTIKTDENYYFEVNDTLYLYRKSDNEEFETRIELVGGDDFRVISFTVPSGSTIDEYRLFKPNILKPSTAYELHDGTGKYVWRDFIPCSKLFRGSDLYDSLFTNGAIYFHKDINFYLKRQDPYGEYGLRPGYNTNLDFCIQPGDLEFEGNIQDISAGDYFEPGENNRC